MLRGLSKIKLFFLQNAPWAPARYFIGLVENKFQSQQKTAPKFNSGAVYSTINKTNSTQFIASLHQGLYKDLRWNSIYCIQHL